MTGVERLLEWTEDPGLRGYLGFVARQAPLTNAEESALAQRIRHGDGDALDKLVNANLRFVVRFVGRFRNRGLDELDLIAEGTVGLIMAVRRSGWRGERRIVAVAVWWILDAVREAIDERSGRGTVLLLPGTPQASSGPRCSTKRSRPGPGPVGAPAGAAPHGGDSARHGRGPECGYTVQAGPTPTVRMTAADGGLTPGRGHRR